MSQSDLFQKLRTILLPYAAHLVVVTDEPSNYYLETQHIMKNKKPMFFAAVRTGKSYTSFHFMPVYTFPELLNGVSQALLKRMQGKSCFNFQEIEPVLFAELTTLVGRGFEQYQNAGYILAKA